MKKVKQLLQSLWNAVKTQQDKKISGEDNLTELKKKEAVSANAVLGADFSKLSDSEKKSLKIENGVKISGLKAGRLKNNGIREGFIITRLNNKSVNSAEEVDDAINSSESNMLLHHQLPLS